MPWKLSCTVGEDPLVDVETGSVCDDLAGPGGPGSRGTIRDALPGGRCARRETGMRCPAHRPAAVLWTDPTTGIKRATATTRTAGHDHILSLCTMALIP